jgi:hypothetical protein
MVEKGHRERPMPVSPEGTRGGLRWIGAMRPGFFLPASWSEVLSGCQTSSLRRPLYIW